MTISKKITRIIALTIAIFALCLLCGCSQENTNQESTSEKVVVDPTMNPSAEAVIEKLKTIDDIKDIEAVTEETDPYNDLGKDGGHTAVIFFSSPLVKQSEVSGKTLIDKGTAAGGSIEVYATVEGAEKRDAYLADFDGTIIKPGSHTVLGTMVVRTSDQLKASQQDKLESEIVDALSAQ